MGYGDPHVLIGKTIVRVYLADDGGAIKFELDDGREIVAKADGDCCSRTWIENVENADFIIGVPVTNAMDVGGIGEKGRQGDDEDEGEYIQFYGFEITTPMGACQIDYRNSSNGYYGGNLSWDDEYFYGGVFGQNVSKEQWTLIAGRKKEGN